MPAFDVAPARGYQEGGIYSLVKNRALFDESEKPARCTNAIRLIDPAGR
jgi:hypothetical protein